jgi:hypothetical protein
MCSEMFLLCCLSPSARKVIQNDLISSLDFEIIDMHLKFVPKILAFNIKYYRQQVTNK